MVEGARERLSVIVIKASLGAGGSFLAAAFILQAILERGFMIAAAVATFVMIALVCYLFGRIRPHLFSAFTLLWLVLLAVLRGWGF